MQGVVRVYRSHQRPSPLQSHRGPVLQNRNILTHSSRVRDRSQVHFVLPAALSIIPLNRYRCMIFSPAVSAGFDAATRLIPEGPGSFTEQWLVDSTLQRVLRLFHQKHNIVALTLPLHRR